jgi:hypothetical protein
MPSSPPHPCQARPRIHAKLAAAGLGLGMPLPAASANGNGTAEQNSCFSKQDAMPSAFRAWKYLQMSAVTCASVRLVFSFCEILVLKYFRGLTMLYICNSQLSHPVLEGKPNANYVRARIRTHVHSGYINEHQRTLLE